MTQTYGPGLIEEGVGALAIAATVLFSPLVRPWYSRWGATAAEVEMSLPGDDLVPEPRLSSTRAISIQASAGAIWPWLVQMGQQRGGLYSYQRLENLVGCAIENANRVMPEFQSLQVGDEVGLTPDLAFTVAGIVPERALILRGDLPREGGPPTVWIWIFFLEPIVEGSTRLILRSRLGCAPSLGNMVIWRLFTDPIAFHMERQMLRSIRARAEDSCGHPAANRSP